MLGWVGAARRVVSVNQFGAVGNVAPPRGLSWGGHGASSSCWSDVVPPGLVVVAIATRYKGYRYPIEVIGHAVWLYHCFALSLRDVEEMMLARGVVVTYETIRSWCAKFGPNYAAQLRRRRPRPGDKWHLDEVFVK